MVNTSIHACNKVNCRIYHHALCVFSLNRIIVLCMGTIKGKSVLLFPYCTLERLTRAVYAQVCCTCRISG